jgi:MFS family permease
MTTVSNPALRASPARDATSALDDALFRKLSWRILPVLMFAYITAYVDRVNIGFAKLHMAQDLGFSNAIYGFGAGIFFAGYVLLEVPSNVILAKVGARIWFTRIMVTWGLVSGLTCLVTSPMQFYVMRFLLGAAEAGFIPGLVYYIGEWFPANRRGRAMSVFYTGLALSGLIGGPLSGLVMQSMDQWGGLAGWKWLFILEAMPAGIAAVWMFMAMPGNLMQAKFLEPAERARLAALLAEERTTRVPSSFSQVLRNKYAWLFCLIFFADVFAIYGLGFWTPTLIKAMGASGDFHIGLISAIPNACAVLCMVLFGRSADRMRERRWHLVALFLLGAVGMALTVTWQHTLLLGTLALCLANMGILSMPPLFWSLPTAVLGGGTGAAAGIAFISSFGNIAGFCGPYVVGYVKDATGSTDSAIYALVGSLVAGAALTLLVPKKLVNR